MCDDRTATPAPLRLRDYQLDAIKRIASGRTSMILADEMGLGKTATAVIAARYLSPRGNILVIAPKNALGVWQREIKQWAGEDAYIWSGDQHRRTKVAKQFTQFGDNVEHTFLVTNYALLEKLKLTPGFPTTFDVVIVDEAHTIRNRKTKTFKSVKDVVSPKATTTLLLTGSPVVNNLDDLWTLLHLSDPQRWSSYWRFVDTYLHKFHNGWGWEIGGPKAPEKFQRDTAPYVIRRTKADVATELPPKIRQQLPISPTGTQAKLYAQMAKDMLIEFEQDGEADFDKWLAAPNHLAQITRLRQILVSPKLIGVDAPSTMLDALVERLTSEIDAKQSAVVFTPFAEAIPLIEAAITAANIVPEASVFTVRGGMSAANLAAEIERFQTIDGPAVLISSLLMGTSWTATRASAAYFLGYHWTAAMNEQAEDRIHRLGQRETARIHYFVNERTIDEYILDIVNRKATWATLALDPRALLLPEGDTE